MEWYARESSPCVDAPCATINDVNLRVLAWTVGVVVHDVSRSWPIGPRAPCRLSGPDALEAETVGLAQKSSLRVG